MSFTSEELKKQIEETLNTATVVPDGHRGAFVVFVDNSGARTAIATKINDVWQISGTVGYHPHEDGLSFGANILATW